MNIFEPVFPAITLTYDSWRWVFCIEGGFSMFVGLVAPFLVPKFPDHTKWMKPDQRRYLYAKLEKDRGTYETGTVDWNSFVQTSKDWTLWVQGSIYMLNVGTANATAFFAPTILTVSYEIRSKHEHNLMTSAGPRIFRSRGQSSFWVSIFRSPRSSGHHFNDLGQISEKSNCVHLQYLCYDPWFRQ